jgi:hypothetical protein
MFPGLVKQDEQADKIQENHQNRCTQCCCHGTMQNSAILPLWELLIDLQKATLVSCEWKTPHGNGAMVDIISSNLIAI